jgi:hypothetical protein
MAQICLIGIAVAAQISTTAVAAQISTTAVRPRPFLATVADTSATQKTTATAGEVSAHISTTAGATVAVTTATHRLVKVGQ